jgi:hypothetical protein
MFDGKKVKIVSFFGESEVTIDFVSTVCFNDFGNLNLLVVVQF